MKKNTKILIFVLVIILIALGLFFLLRGRAPEAEPSLTLSPMPSIEHAKGMVGFVHQNVEQDTIDTFVSACEKEKTEVLQFKTESKQDALANAETFLSRNVDVLVISDYGTEIISNVLKKANEKNIPVVVLEKVHEGASFFGIDKEQEGKLLAETAMTNQNTFDLVIAIGNTAKQSTQSKAATDAIIEKTSLDPAYVIYTNGGQSVENAKSEVELRLADSPDRMNILVIADSDQLAQGALAATEDQTNDRQIVIVSFDGGAEAINNFSGEQNQWLATTTYSLSDYGERLYETVMNLKTNGGKVDGKAQCEIMTYK